MTAKKVKTPVEAEEFGTPIITEPDLGFFETKGTVYANLPHSDEPVTSGPYDPTVLGSKDGQIPDQPVK